MLISKKDLFLWLTMLQVFLALLYYMSFKVTESNKIRVSEFLSLSNITSYVFNSKSWIVNENVLQYSTILSSNNNILEIESITFFKERNIRVISEFSRCVINLDTVVNLIKVPSQVLKLEQTRFDIYKVVCIIEPREYIGYNISQVTVAVINYQDFLGFNVEKLFFHQPKFIEKRIKKLNTTINCVHTLRNINKKMHANIQNWIEINKLIGVAKIRIYALEYENVYLKEIKSKYTNYVEIVEHEVNITKICFNLYRQRNTHYENCIKKYGEYFKLIDKGDEMTIGLHEKLCTNDCLMDNKHVYQYLTNYDVDEFILPRQFQTNYAERVDELSLGCERVYEKYLNNTSRLKSFKINDYIQRLNTIYGKDVACFRFENHLFLNNNEYLYDKINKLSLTNKNRKQYLTYEKNEFTKLRYSIEKPADIAYLEKLKKFDNITRCLNNVYVDRKTVNLVAKWKNYLTTLFNNRDGKTIFNTDFVDSINVHSAYLIKKEKKAIFVPTIYGYVSHMRDKDIDMYKNEDWLSYPIQHLKVDLEYAFFIISNLK